MFFNERCLACPEVLRHVTSGNVFFSSSFGFSYTVGILSPSYRGSVTFRTNRSTGPLADEAIDSMGSCIGWADIGQAWERGKEADDGPRRNR